MKSVGQILKTAREKKKYSIETISAMTAIIPAYVQAIERDEFGSLPGDVATRGFLTLYARAVAIDPRSILSVYRRDVITDDGHEETLRTHFFVIGRRRLLRAVMSAGILGIGMAAALYGAVFVTRLQQAPGLTVYSPTDQALVASPILVRGKTASDAVVTIDGEAIGVNQDGIFAKEIEIDPGQHILTIKVIGRNGKERATQLMVSVDETK